MYVIYFVFFIVVFFCTFISPSWWLFCCFCIYNYSTLCSLLFRIVCNIAFMREDVVKIPSFKICVHVVFILFVRLYCKKMLNVYKAIKVLVLSVFSLVIG